CSVEVVDGEGRPVPTTFQGERVGLCSVVLGGDHEFARRSPGRIGAHGLAGGRLTVDVVSGEGGRPGLLDEGVRSVWPRGGAEADDIDRGRAVGPGPVPELARWVVSPALHAAPGREGAGVLDAGRDRRDARAKARDVDRPRA